MQSSRVGIVALIVTQPHGEQEPLLVERFSDEREIGLFEAALTAGEVSPLALVYEMRERQKREEEEFGNYVEELLSQPFVRNEVQKHGLEWLKSKSRMEEYQATEREATEIIAQYAFKIFCEDHQKTEFFLAGPSVRVKIRVFQVPFAESQSESEAA
jgi:hypothetical protein